MGGTTMSRMLMTLSRTMVASLLIATAGIAYAVDGDPLGYTLLIQQSPADAGAVTPGAGVHKVTVGQAVTLSAVPRPGYQFLYWLGDVSSPTATEVTISVDSPKMVVAVFGRESFEDELLQGGGLGMSQSGQGAGGGLRASPYPITGAGGVSAGAGRGGQVVNFIAPPIDDPFDDDDVKFPVPGEGEGDENNDIPVPGDQIPEPATALLLGLGTAILLRRRKSRQ